MHGGDFEARREAPDILKPFRLGLPRQPANRRLHAPQNMLASCLAYRQKPEGRSHYRRRSGIEISAGRFLPPPAEQATHRPKSYSMMARTRATLDRPKEILK